ncbi:MAG: protein kinase, partial [Xenococcus sp. (in: cyanobacteria)]
MIGEVIRRRYKIIAEIGKDKAGISETYLAEDLDMPVNPKPKRVVKCLQPQIINDDIRRLFNKEADILYKLGEKSDRIPTLYAFFEEEGRFYIVQEYIDGNDLSDELTPGTKWDEAKVINFLQEMLEILAFVHANNVIHRDIKPQNIMRRKDSRLVFIDFGAIKEIATRPIDSSTTPFTFSIGTPDYIPIEQFRGKPEYSSDIYALGITAIQ